MLRKNIDDGGQAFPVHELCLGMSLRDYFACSVRVDEYLTTAESKWHYDQLGKKLTGRECPNALDDPFEHARWWLEVDAHIRFMAADAMIKARRA